eukprot:GHVS01063315.1.p1 GENE.GHVS01063315.1~~GHVS01063315.1.p1  ORF type:complete len:406 (-),score=58.39 GHVS01063315.1:132-1349(-)
MALVADKLHGSLASLSWLQLAALAQPRPALSYRPVSSFACTCRCPSTGVPRLHGISADIGASLCLGYGYLRARCFSQAAGVFAAALQKLPTFSEAWEGLGKALRLQGKEADANYCFGMGQKSLSSLDPDVPIARLLRSGYLLRAPGLPVAGGGSAAFLTHCLRHPSLFSFLNYVTGPTAIRHSEDNGGSRGEDEGSRALAKMIRRPFSRQSNITIDPSMPPPSAFTAIPPPAVPEFVATCPLSLPSKNRRTIDEQSSPTLGSRAARIDVDGDGGGRQPLSAWNVSEEEERKGEERADTEMLGCEGEEEEPERGGEAHSARMLGCDWPWRGRTPSESLQQKHARWTRLLEEGCDMERMQEWIDRMDETRLDRQCIRLVVQGITSQSNDERPVSLYADATFIDANNA